MISLLGFIVIVAVLALRPWAKAQLVAPALLVLVLAIAGTFGATIWNITADNAITGIPQRSPMSDDDTFTSQTLFLVGALSACIVLMGVALAAQDPRSFNTADHRQTYLARRQLMIRSVVHYLPLLSAVAVLILVLWVVGQGQSLIYEERYLGQGGIPLLQKATNPLAPFSVLVFFLMGVKGLPRRPRWPVISFALLLTWWALLAFNGTRLSILVALLLGIRFVALLPRPVKFVGPLIILQFVALSIEIVRNARLLPHGLSTAPTYLFQTNGVNLYGPDAILSAANFIGKNLSGFVFVTAQTAKRPIPTETILASMNPLPGFLGGPPSVRREELLLPWVPFTTIGEIGGAWGFAGVSAISALAALLLALATRGLGRSRLGTIAFFVTLGLTPILIIFLVQYPPRNTFRILWLLVALAALANSNRAPGGGALSTREHLRTGVK